MTKIGKILLGLMAVLLIFLIALATVYTRKTAGSIDGLAAYQATLLVESLAGEIQARISAELKILSIAAGDFPVAGPWRPKHQERAGHSNRLKEILKKLGDEWESIFVADASGVVYADGTDGGYSGMNVGSSDYFKAAHGGIAAVGKPLQTRAGNLASMVAVPLFDRQKKFTGCLVAVLKLDPLFQRIVSIRLGGSGYSFVTEKDGMVIAHSNKGSALQLHVRTLLGMEGIVGMILSGKSGADMFHSDGVRKRVSYAPVKLTGWSVCVVQEAEDLVILPRSTRNLIIVVSVVLLVVILIAALLLHFQASGTPEEVVQPKDTSPGKDPDQVRVEMSVRPVVQNTRAPEEAAPKESALSERGSADSYVGHGRSLVGGLGVKIGSDFDRVSTFLKRPFEKQNHYEVLELPPSATPFEVRQAYKTALQIYRTGSMVSYSFFSEEERKRILDRIEKAYETLINDASRADYDRMLVEHGEIEDGAGYRKARRKPIAAIERNETESDHSMEPSGGGRTKRDPDSSVIQEILNRKSLSGGDLRRIRIEKGMSLSEISEVTRIRIGILHAMEEDQLDQIPFRLNLEKYLRAYAGCLSLDSDLVIRKYINRTG